MKAWLCTLLQHLLKTLFKGAGGQLSPRCIFDPLGVQVNKLANTCTCRGLSPSPLNLSFPLYFLKHYFHPPLKQFLDENLSVHFTSTFAEKIWSVAKDHTWYSTGHCSNFCGILIVLTKRKSPLAICIAIMYVHNQKKFQTTCTCN